LLILAAAFIPMQQKLKPFYMARKLTFFSLLFALVGLLGCKTSQKSYPSTPTVGMFKVAILYPNGDDKTFDMDYYEKKHMPMVAGFLGKNLKFYEIDKGIAGRTPNDKGAFCCYRLFLY
jgi:hypothetical protein